MDGGLEALEMHFGVMFPHRWLYAAGNTIRDFAEEAEALGYTSLWVTDHIVVPSYRTERGHIFYEALTTLAYVSSITTRCRLGVAVLALPPRNPVLVAKQVATLDALSQGRVILGVGTGWIEEELRYLGASCVSSRPLTEHMSLDIFGDRRCARCLQFAVFWMVKNGAGT
jgi:alkanesulfonate monooxygenase SsuD/methylene tetrahydromethanopterin reductase-like flavin-dependent oxidoreductase (luciferase family)